MSEFERADKQLNIGFRRRIVENCNYLFLSSNREHLPPSFIFQNSVQTSVRNVKEGTERKTC